MKNYRYFGRYSPKEWETDKQWLGKRLDFLWEVRNYYPSTYNQLRMYEEKEDFYDVNDSVVSQVARDSSSYSDGECDRYDKIHLKELVSKYKMLCTMKNENRDEFMKKCNCNLYAYCTERKYDDIKQYIYEEE